MHQRQVGGAPARRVDVAPRSLQQGQRHADQAGIVGIESIGLAVERHRARPGRLGDPFVEQLLVLDHFVVGRGEVPVGLLRGRSCGGRRGFGLLHRRGRGGRYHWRIGLAQLAGESLQQGPEALLFQPRQQHVGIGLALVEGLGLGRCRHVVAQGHELLGDADQLGIVLQRFAPLRLLDLPGALQQRFESAVLVDQLGRGLDTDAGGPRHIVGRIAGQRLHVHDLVRRHAELLEHRLGPELDLLDRVHQLDARPHELHQVLVGGHDGAGAAGLDGHAGVGRDQVVGLIARELAHRDVERAGGLADQRELRDQVFRRIGPVGLVLVVDLVAEGHAAGVEDHRDMVDLGIVQQVGHQHAAEAEHGIDRRPVGPVHRRQGVIGAEQIARAVDQVEVAERLVVAVRRGRRGSRGFRHDQGLARWAVRREMGL